jgi:pimeloyl-ACP methyl ester carboxylesterase
VTGTPADPINPIPEASSLPAATVEVWPRTYHFPHLADPQRFARRLAGTAQWVAQ